MTLLWNSLYIRVSQIVVVNVQTGKSMLATSGQHWFTSLNIWDTLLSIHVLLRSYLNQKWKSIKYLIRTRKYCRFAVHLVVSGSNQIYLVTFTYGQLTQASFLQLDVILGTKVVQFWSYQKMYFTKNVVINWYFSMKFIFQKDSNVFWHRKLTLNVQISWFSTPMCHLSVTNIKKPFCNVWFFL